MKTNIDLLRFMPRHVQTRDQYNDSWVVQHMQAIKSPKTLQEQALVSLLSGLLLYDDYLESVGYIAAEDDALGSVWLDMADRIKALLDGDVGRLDTGVLLVILDRVRARQGFEAE